jgi:hypothetical protein
MMRKLTKTILISFLALAAGCISIERTGEYYVAMKTMTFGKMQEYKDDDAYKPLLLSIGKPGYDGGTMYLPPSVGVNIVYAGAYMEHKFLPVTLILWPVGIGVWWVEAFVLAPAWDTLCLPYDMYLRDDYLENERQKTDTSERPAL